MSRSFMQEKLLTEKGYQPYCGAYKCFCSWPRSTFNGKQFTCRCGWVSRYPREFIREYKVKWGIK